MEEMVDVVTADDVKLGIATRREVHKSGAWHRGVHVLVFNPRGELLVQRRSAGKDKSPGALDLSVSEHSKAGETYDEAAARGLREELGIEAVPFAKILKFRLVYGPADNMISVLYRSTYDGRLSPDATEVAEVVAFKPEALRNLVSEEGQEMTLWAREILRWYLHLPSGVEEA